MDMTFLLSQIELREALELIESQQDELELDEFIEQVSSKITLNIAQITQAFSESDTTQIIKNLVRELKFYEQLNLQAKQLMDEWI